MVNFHNIREMWSTFATIAYFAKLDILLKFDYIRIFRTKPFCPVSALPVDPIGSCPCCLPAPMHNARILFTSGRTSPLVKNRGGRRLDGRVVTADPNRCMDYKG